MREWDSKTPTVEDWSGPCPRPLLVLLRWRVCESRDCDAAALINCSGLCSCEPTWVDGRAGARDRHRVSLHTVQQVMLTAWAPQPLATSRAAGCCIVSVTTRLVSELPESLSTTGGAMPTATKRRRGASLPAPSAAPTTALKFKVLSFFVGSTAAGRGRLHQQSIVLSDGINSADEEVVSRGAAG